MVAAVLLVLVLLLAGAWFGRVGGLSLGMRRSLPAAIGLDQPAAEPARPAVDPAPAPARPPAPAGATGTEEPEGPAAEIDASPPMPGPEQGSPDPAKDPAAEHAREPPPEAPPQAPVVRSESGSPARGGGQRHDRLAASTSAARPDQAAPPEQDEAHPPAGKAPAEASDEAKADAPEEEPVAVAHKPAELPIPLQPRRPSDARSEGPRDHVSVARGDTLHELASRRYGSSNLTTLDMLQAANPEIQSMDLIIAGSGLVFPDPGPASRVLRESGGFSVLAVTTPVLAQALAVQSSLEDRLGRPVSLERVENRNRENLYRVAVRGLGDQDQAMQIADDLGSILRDPTP